MPLDCYWGNPNPNWGSADPNVGGGPALVRDDTDGAGPELLVFPTPDEGLTYRVGVHYFDDPGFGPAHAFVRVFAHGESRWFGASRLDQGDLWCAALVGDAPLLSTQPCVDELGQPDITPDYPLPGSGTSSP